MLCSGGMKVHRQHMQVRFTVDAAPMLLVKRTTPLSQPALGYVEATMRTPGANESWKVSHAQQLAIDPSPS